MFTVIAQGNGGVIFNRNKNCDKDEEMEILKATKEERKMRVELAIA